MLSEGQEWPGGGWVSQTPDLWSCVSTQQSCDKYCSFPLHSQAAKSNMWGGKISPKSDELNLSSGAGAAVWVPAVETWWEWGSGSVTSVPPSSNCPAHPAGNSARFSFFHSLELQLLNKMDINKCTQAYWKSTRGAQTRVQLASTPKMRPFSANKLLSLIVIPNFCFNST